MSATLHRASSAVAQDLISVRVQPREVRRNSVSVTAVDNINGSFINRKNAEIGSKLSIAMNINEAPVHRTG